MKMHALQTMSPWRYLALTSLTALAPLGCELDLEATLEELNDSDDVDNHTPSTSTATTLTTSEESSSFVEPTTTSTGETSASTGTLTTSDPDGSGATSSTPNEVARLRLLHGSVGGPGIDLFIDDNETALVRRLQYASTSAYVDVPAGTHRLTARVSGAPLTDPPLFELADLALAVDKPYTITATGSSGSSDLATSFRLAAYTDDFATPSAGKAVVRLVHAGIDLPAVQVEIPDAGASVALERFAGSAATGIQVPANAPFEVKLIVDSTSSHAFTTVPLAEGSTLYLLIVGSQASHARLDTGLALLGAASNRDIFAIQPDPLVYALHTSADAPALDLCDGEVAILSNVGRGELKSASLTPGSRALTAYPAGTSCTGTPLARQSVGFGRGQRYLLTVQGEVEVEADDPSSLTIDTHLDWFSPDAAGQSLLRAVHAASAPMVDVGAINNAGITPALRYVLFENLNIGDLSHELPVGPRAYPIGIQQPDAIIPASALARFRVDAIADHKSFVVSAGDLTPEGDDVPMQVFAVDTTVVPWNLIEAPRF